MKLPNKITLFRFLLQFIVLYGLLNPGSFSYTVLFVLFLINVIFDKVDGVVARKLNQESVIGRFLDALVDKFTLHSLLVIFVIKLPDVFSLNLYILILFRDLFVEILRQYSLSNRLKAKISQVGRYKVLVEYVALTLGFVFLLGYPMAHFINILMITAVVLGFISLFEYVYSLRKNIKKNL